MSGRLVFDTAIGPCGLAWSERGIAAVLLPERDEDLLRERLRRRAPGADERPPPPEIARAVDGMAALLAGGDPDLREVALDLAGASEFDRRIYDVARDIARGRTLTYGEVARRIGEPGAAQAVGQALGRNPCPIVVPCHRVLAAGGKLGGFSAPGGAWSKRRLLAIEGALPAPTLFDLTPP